MGESSYAAICSCSAPALPVKAEGLTALLSACQLGISVVLWCQLKAMRLKCKKHTGGGNREFA